MQIHVLAAVVNESWFAQRWIHDWWRTDHVADPSNQKAGMLLHSLIAHYDRAGPVALRADFEGTST
jgi:hypothetical protein